MSATSWTLTLLRRFTDRCALCKDGLCPLCQAEARAVDSVFLPIIAALVDGHMNVMQSCRECGPREASCDTCMIAVDALALISPADRAIIDAWIKEHKR